MKKGEKGVEIEDVGRKVCGRGGNEWRNQENCLGLEQGGGRTEQGVGRSSIKRSGKDGGTKTDTRRKTTIFWMVTLGAREGTGP